MLNCSSCGEDTIHGACDVQLFPTAFLTLADIILSYFIVCNSVVESLKIDYLDDKDEKLVLISGQFSLLSLFIAEANVASFFTLFIYFNSFS